MATRPPQLFWRISSAYLVLLLVLGVVYLIWGLQSARSFARETDQKLNHELANELAKTFHSYLEPELDTDGIGHAFHDLMVMNPRVELYLLDASGSLVAYFAPAEKIRRMQVALDPILEFVDGGELPILGDDPRSPDRTKPFTVTEVTLGGEPGYLYAILGGERYDTASALVGNSRIVRSGAIAVIVALLTTAAAGLVLFFFLTQRLNRLTNAVERFEGGHLDSRTNESSGDEIGKLGRAFDGMAERIGDQVKQLERSDRNRRELVANISHDLRSPLSSIRGYVETMLMKYSELSESECREYLNTILQNSDRLAHLVDSLFELSRLEAQETPIHNEPFSLVELAHDVSKKLQPQATDTGIEVAIVVNGDQLDGSQMTLCMVEGDVRLIERALSNLLDNALRYSPKGSHVEIRLDDHESGTALSVVDDGPGIPTAEQALVFDRFYRIDKSRSTRSGGSGLGLAIAQRILQMHRGMIRLASESGEGTAFSFELPRPS
jgi:signal transduction histidine kinase